MKKTKIILLGMAALALMVTPLASNALSGTNADDVEVRIFTKQGGEWFKVKTKKADFRGVLIAKNVLPGKYKVEVADEDVTTPQTLAGEFKMLDSEGRRIDHKTDVDVYMYISGVKTLIVTYETDADGWLDLPSMTPGASYYFDVKEESDLGSTEGKIRIKVKSKIEGSEWYQSLYSRTDENGVLRIKDVSSGKYKFKYKSGDADPAQPFILQLRMLKNNGKRIKDKTDVELFVYMNKVRVKVADLETNADGWLTLPGVMTGMKYKLKVKD
ncbi:MAG TPA: hypothetical protein ENG89_01240 [Candidatus Moranbacteria bacterium]|nr:hypothetical protein [Candidatus Moranbacteria bacterium]